MYLFFTYFNEKVQKELKLKGYRPCEGIKNKDFVKKLFEWHEPSFKYQDTQYNKERTEIRFCNGEMLSKKEGVRCNKCKFWYEHVRKKKKHQEMFFIQNHS